MKYETDADRDAKAIQDWAEQEEKKETGGKELNFEGRGEGRDSVLKTRAWCLTKEYEP